MTFDNQQRHEGALTRVLLVETNILQIKARIEA